MTLQYPLTSEPQTGDGSFVAVAPGVLWLRMPLFGSLKWINTWAIEEQNGWALIDTGLNTPQTLEAWQAVFAGPMHGRPATRVVVTHMHPDHCGLAGWLAERFEVTLWTVSYTHLDVYKRQVRRSTPAPRRVERTRAPARYGAGSACRRRFLRR